MSCVSPQPSPNSEQLPLSRLVCLLAAAVAAMAFYGCVGIQDPTPVPTNTPAPPPVISSNQEFRSPQVLAGRELFNANCAQCHGPGATGTDLGPPLLHQVYLPYHHSDAAFRSAVQNGVPMHHWFFGDMPPVPGLSTDQVDSIICYVRQAQFETGMPRAEAC